MATRDAKLLDLNGNVWEERVQVPTHGLANSVPAVVVMGDKTFKWDSKSNAYRQIEAYVIPLPWRRNISGW